MIYKTLHVKLKDWLNWTPFKKGMNSDAANLYQRNFIYELQTLKYRVNWEMYSLYAGAAGMLLPLPINATCTNWIELKLPFVWQNVVLYWLTLSISRYEADPFVSLVFFISSSVGQVRPTYSPNFLGKWHQLYTGTWNSRNVLVSFCLACEALE